MTPGLITTIFDSDRTINTFHIGTLSTPFSVGQHQYGGEIGEIIVYDRELSSEEIEEAKQYLMDKWGLF